LVLCVVVVVSVGCGVCHVHVAVCILEQVVQVVAS